MKKRMASVLIEMNVQKSRIYFHSIQELATSQESAQTRKDRTIAMSAPTALSLTRGTKKTV